MKKVKRDYYAEQALKEQKLNEAVKSLLPPKVVFPDDGSDYFESPPEGGAFKKDLLIDKQSSIIPPKKQIQKHQKKHVGVRPKIAIVIDDVGMNLKQSRAAIDLPSSVTLAFLPYAETVSTLADKSINQGHELLIHIPMEAMNADVPLGSMALREEMDSAAFEAEFSKIANSFKGYVGVNNHMGSRLTQNPEAMGFLMDQLKRRGLFFLDSRTIHTSIAEETAAAYNIPHAARDVFLDHEETPEYIAEALKNVERIARENGAVIAIGHPKALTMEILKEWVKTVPEKGFELVPLSALLVQPEAVEAQPIVISAPTQWHSPPLE